MIDLLLLALVLAYAVSGYRQGLAVGLLSLLGFVGGALLGMWLVPPLTDALTDGLQRSVLLLAAVLLLAWLGQFGGAVLGGRVRDQLKLPAARVLDHVLGAVAGVVAVSLVLWFVGGALRAIDRPVVARAVAESRVLGAIDAVVPQSLGGLATRFQQAISDTPFPRVFEGVGPERIDVVAPPDVTAMSAQVQQRVRRSVVKVTGEAPACGRGQEGSGVVVAPGRVATNAHVVAAVNDPRVQLADGGQRYPARTVLFDPRTDIAVLAVDGLPAPALPLGTDLGRGADAVVAGYPLNGPYTAVAARVRSVLRATGQDIYGGSGAVRQVYSLFARVEQGNSGGPLLSPDGSVVGIVFAQSLDDPSTGYALTMAEVMDEIRVGIGSALPVTTGGCAAG